MHCLYPITIRNPKWSTVDALRGVPSYIQVPCGRCIACQERKRSAWAFRMLNEATICSDLCVFATLTYNEDAVPKTSQGHLTLDRSALQKFMKRLRKRAGKSFSFRYFGCGEYGGQTLRPHYHIILFCKDGSDVVDFFKVRDLVESAWQFGFSSLSPSNVNRFRYVAKYVCKVGFSEDQDVDDEVVEPFALMSLKPGIGAAYMTEDMLRYIMENDNFGAYLGNEPIALPRFYIDKLPESVRRFHSENVRQLFDNRLSRKEDNNIRFTSVSFQSLQADLAYEQFKLKQLNQHYGKVYRRKENDG